MNKAVTVTWEYFHCNVLISAPANRFGEYICMLNRYMLVLITVQNKYRTSNHLSSKKGIVFNEKLVPFTP